MGSNYEFDMCQEGNLDFVKMAINGKLVNIDDTDYFGNTLLYYAIREEHVDIVKFLVEAGARLNYPSGNREKAPLPTAKRVGNQEITDYLKSQGAK